VIKKVIFIFVFSIFSNSLLAMTQEDFEKELEKYSERHLKLTNELNEAISGDLSKSAMSSPIFLIKTCEIYLNLLSTEKFANQYGYDIYEDNSNFQEQAYIYGQLIESIKAKPEYCANAIGQDAFNRIINNS